MARKWKIWCDAGYVVWEKVAVIGYYLEDSSGKKVGEKAIRLPFEEIKDVSHAEYLALLTAIKKVKELKGEEVIIHTDSITCLDHLKKYETSKYPIKNCFKDIFAKVKTDILNEIGKNAEVKLENIKWCKGKENKAHRVCHRELDKIRSEKKIDIWGQIGNFA